MKEEPFLDYYEVLQLSPNAHSETIERVFRILAKRYHPDNKVTGTAEKFNVLTKAYKVLSDPEKRAAYDVKYDKQHVLKWDLFAEASASEGTEGDERIQQAILSLLYLSRRRDASNPGMGTIELERILGCPEKHMEFHIWYLREKRWIERTDSGGFAITADGVDAAREQDFLLRKDRLLEENNPLGNGGVPARSRLNEGVVSPGSRRNSEAGG
jgi:curved DNA-binding protein